MRTLLFALTLALTPCALHAQGTPAPASLGLDTPIETILASPVGKAVLERDMPEMLTHPVFEMFKGMSLQQMKAMANGAIDDVMLTKMEEDLRAIQ